MKKIATLLFALMFTSKLFAQPGVSATIQNMHLWRGGEVADGIVLTTDLYYAALQERVKFGFWGGTNSVGEYKEFNYYLNYQEGNFSLSLSDTYNFADYATYNNEEFFNYDPATTGRFLDANLTYQFGECFPLKLSWATVLFGRDRDASNSQNRYSTFCSASYSIYDQKGWKIDIGAGMAFALNNIDNSANFYGERSGIVETTLKVSYVATINDYNIPLSITAMCNPQSNKGYLQLSAQVITF